MKGQFQFILAILISLNTSCSDTDTIARGQQPQVTIDSKGAVRIVFGVDDTIFCATSLDNGLTFKKQKVGEVKDMGLGMSRGPQLATSANYSLVAAVNKKGTIHTFQLNHSTNNWVKTTIINDIPDSAPEGLVSIAADQDDNFYAVWLDLRDDKQNKICFSSTTDKGQSWLKNSIAYRSPDRTVCECCKPSIEVSESRVLIMFRNWINGSRDLYLLQSDNKGAEFGEPQKLGKGTWKLNGCPMDGGGIAVDKESIIHSVWQREGEIFYAQPQQSEMKIGDGRDCAITRGDHPVITWQDGDELKVKELSSMETLTIGKGSFIKAARTADNKILCVWENDNRIEFKKL